jgi:hypothetical protein
MPSEVPAAAGWCQRQLDTGRAAEDVTNSSTPQGPRDRAPAALAVDRFRSSPEKHSQCRDDRARMTANAGGRTDDPK